MFSSQPDKLQAQYTARLDGLNHSAQALTLAELAERESKLQLVVTDNSATALRLEQELAFFAGNIPVMLLPDWETLPYDTFSPHQDIISDRLHILANLPDTKSGVLIAPVSSLMQRLAPPDYLAGRSLTFTRGEQLDVHKLRLQFEAAGYRKVDTVFEHGEYALRGALLDVFPMGSKVPYRVDLFDDEIDSLRSFDPESQMTVEKVDAIKLLPGQEFPLDEAGIETFKTRWHQHFNVDHRQVPLYQDISQGIAAAGVEYYLPLFFEQTANLFEYLPSDAIIATTEGVEAAAQRYWRDANERYEQRRVDNRRPILAPVDIFLPVDVVFSELKCFPRVNLTSEGANARLLSGPDLKIDAHATKPLERLERYLGEHNEVLFCAESSGRREALIELLTRHSLRPEAVDNWSDWKDSPPPLAITVAPLSEGLELADTRRALVAESQLFGQRVTQARRRKRTSNNAFSEENAIRNLAELRIGAPVVHLDNGVGRYQGLKTIDIDGQDSEFVVLEYADDAMLYVPVSMLHLISRYAGADEDTAPLHRLGSDQWSKARRKAQEKIRDVAAELLDIYAKREARKGHSMALDDNDYQLFANSFPFEETPDQEQAIEAVIEDMKAPKPMDRLICGDVGFGKTEVAMRAAFIAVTNGKQVAVLVPTTLLAQQHFESFRDRFSEWPVAIEVLSRFRSAAEQKDVIERLARGKVDILIGTHKILNKEVKYDDLGLVIIDEEHRFGVRQKEVLKSLRAEVDILTLTATPIPRTLNMSMSGMRDLSIIATPPARRLSIKTFVQERNPATIQEAILREVQRGGQVYYLHNEVASIEKARNELQKLMPEMRIGIGHGQMGERELEQVMSDFYHKRFNVLVCSTIIETGIDVPSANTIIIERADKFGLAQLHQLRGRVGRSHHQAYAYLLTPAHAKITGDAAKRLTAISETIDLGAGFTLASQDMEIRGAGELLGDEQSGQIQSIGFSLYMDLLERAVNAMKASGSKDIDLNATESSVDVNLRVPALIPDDYLPDVQSRLVLYKRIAGCKDETALHELQVEMIDRFGLLPEPTKRLIRITRLKQRCEEIGITGAEAGPTGGKLSFADATRVDPMSLVKLVQSDPDSFQFSGATALRFKADLEDADARFDFVDQLLDSIHA